MKQYLDLLRLVLDTGCVTKSRGVLPSTGGGVETRSIFGHQLRVDLRAGFPLLTTKKVSFKSIAIELLWFLRGETNTRFLEENGVTIWNEWKDENGELGPVYGKQWRAWAGPEGPIDQIARLVDGLQRDPDGRRHILSAWNVGDLPAMRLPPCHILSQFYVAEGRLSCQLYQRSADLFLGVPYNIASYSLLTHLLAQVVGLDVGELVHTFGDAHIYSNHLEAVHAQLARTPTALPRLVLDPSVTRIDDFTFAHMKIEGYAPQPAIGAEVVV